MSASPVGKRIGTAPPLSLWNTISVLASNCRFSSAARISPTAPSSAVTAAA
jgi:hypothetical protein